MMPYLFVIAVFWLSPTLAHPQETGVVLCQKNSGVTPMRWVGEEGPESLMETLKICNESGGRVSQIRKTEFSYSEESEEEEPIKPSAIWKNLVSNSNAVSAWAKVMEDIYKPVS